MISGIITLGLLLLCAAPALAGFALEAKDRRKQRQRQLASAPRARSTVVEFPTYRKRR
jgi:predicted outer membrane lipoprotein